MATTFARALARHIRICRRRSLRRVAKRLYDRKPGKLRHIILYGASTYQNHTVDYDSGSFLVSSQAEDPAHASRKTTNYCADQYFGMLSDNYRHSNIINERMLINVGRIPARTPAQAQAANAKDAAGSTPPLRIVVLR